MDTAQADIYANLIESRRAVLDAYYENLKELHKTKNVPPDIFEKFADLTLTVLADLTKRIEAHPLHQKE